MKTLFGIALLLYGVCACNPASDQEVVVQAVAGPNGVTVVAPAAGQLTVTWTADPVAFKYYVFQAVSGGAFVYVASVLDPTDPFGRPPPATYTAGGLVGGTQYCYEIQSAYPDGTMSDLGAGGCGVATGAGPPSSTQYNVPLQPFAEINWFTTVQASPTTQAYLQSSGSGGAVIWLPSQPGRSLVAVTLAMKSPSGGFFNAIRVMKFYKDDTAAQQVGGLENLPSAPPSWTDLTIPTASTPSDAGYDLALLLDARTADLRVKAIRATYN